MKINFIKIIILVLITNIPFFAEANEKQLDWPQITTNDLHKMHDTLVDNTVQYIDKYKPFMDWLDSGLNETLIIAKNVNSEAGYYYTLSRYATGFNNGHIAITNLNQRFPKKYADLIMQYQNGKYFVKYREPNYQNLPPLNSVLISCDKVNAQKIVDNDIISYQFTSQLEASNYKAANYLFFDANPLRNYQKECVFAFEGKKSTYRINWHEISANEAVEIKSLFTKKYFFQIRRFGENGLWISIPTLFPQKSDREFLDMIVNLSSNFRTFDPVVLDFRGNRGGNSEWAKKILNNLYGKTFVTQKLRNQYNKIKETYRVSEDNIVTYQQFALKYPEINIAEKMQSEQKIHHQTFIIENKIIGKTNTEKNLLTQFNNHLYFLTDYDCFSACLNTADLIYSLPHTIHIGLTTDADSPYTENGLQKLPGGANFIHTMKLDKNRPRGENQPYEPKYRYDGNIQNTEDLMQWVLLLNSKK